MYTIEESFDTAIEVKKSKFIAMIVPISQFDGLQEKLRAEHPKSRHVVYALRYLNEYDQIVENSSDDGEPKGSSAPPALNVLRGAKLINCAVLIVRYFGGTKLGIGGLVRAYGNAVKAVIEISDIKKYEKLYFFEYQTDYSRIQRIEYLLKELDIIDIEKEFQSDFVKWKISTTEPKIDKFKTQAGRSIK